MTSKLNLLAGAGMAVAMLATGASPAFAAPAKKKHHAAAARHDSRDSEIEALRQQVEALTQRLDMQEQNSAQATAQINAAQSQAAAAAVTAQAAQTQAAAASTQVPTEVKTQLAKLPKPKNEWANSTSISGRMYFNGSNITQHVNGAKPTGVGSLNGTGFNIKRFYVGIDHTFSPIFSANVTADISNVVGSTGNTNVNPNTTAAPANATTLVGKGFYVKKAYLQAKLNPAFIIRAGAADLPWVPYVENQYGYRHIENTLIDRTNFGTSADWGVHVLGDLAGGLFSYQFSVIDGGGYRNVKVTKSVDFEGRVSASYKGFYAAVGGYDGKRANDTQGALTSTVTVRGVTYVGGDLKTATRVDGLIGYKNKLFNIGGEYYHAKNWNNVTSAIEDKADGYSVFGNVNFAKLWSVFGRYDHVRPSKDAGNTAPELKDDYYNVGIQWEPVKIVDLALVYKHEKVKNGTFSTQNGTVGGANTGTSIFGGDGTYSEIGIFGQLRF